MAKAQIEPIAGILRVFNDDAAYGDPYEIYAIVAFDSPTSCEIRGLKADRPFSKAQAGAVRDELRRYGVKQYQFTRIKNGIERTVTGHIK